MRVKTKRINTHFRQTEKEFRSQKIAQISQHFNRNLPYRIYSFSVRQVRSSVDKMKNTFLQIKPKLPKNSKRIG